MKKSVKTPHFNVTIMGGPIEQDGDFVYRVSAICGKGMCISRLSLTAGMAANLYAHVVDADSPVGRFNNFVVVIISAKAEKTGHAKEGHIYEVTIQVPPGASATHHVGNAITYVVGFGKG